MILFRSLFWTFRNMIKYPYVFFVMIGMNWFPNSVMEMIVPVVTKRMTDDDAFVVAHAIWKWKNCY
jgi:hypothetical protein